MSYWDFVGFGLFAGITAVSLHLAKRTEGERSLLPECVSAAFFAIIGGGCLLIAIITSVALWEKSAINKIEFYLAASCCSAFWIQMVERIFNIVWWLRNPNYKRIEKV